MVVFDAKPQSQQAGVGFRNVHGQEVNNIFMSVST
jgi:hypothetical protein